MVQNVKYIYLGMSYKELSNKLRECIKLKHIPLVDHPRNMILLGSITKTELVALLESQIGAERRKEILPYGIGPDGKVIEDLEAYEKEIKEQQKVEERERIFDKYKVDNKNAIVAFKPKKVFLVNLYIRLCSSLLN